MLNMDRDAQFHLKYVQLAGWTLYWPNINIAMA